MKTRMATIADFKEGATLITSEGYEFTITDKYTDGIWNARGDGGAKVVFETEAGFYTVDNN